MYQVSLLLYVYSRRIDILRISIMLQGIVTPKDIHNDPGNCHSEGLFMSSTNPISSIFFFSRSSQDMPRSFFG